MELNRPARPAPRVSRIVVAHNPVGRDDDASTSDVLAQVELVTGALAALGIEATRLAVAGWRIWEDLAGLGPLGSAAPSDAAAIEPGTLVFNLVEAPPGVPGVHPATAAAIELLGLPFSGASAACLWLTTDKLATRAVLAAEGLPVAPGGRLDGESAEVLERVPPPWILKPACEDASLGLEGGAVCCDREAALARAAELRRRFPGQAVVVERYLPGRELNVSLLAAAAAADGDGGGGSGARGAPRPAEPEALPVAEIEFVDFPPGMPRIVGYEAKWQPESFAYTHTVRRFPEDAASAPLLAEARRLALAAWRACGLAGYGRVDLRLDERGALHILEVNANPCLAADAGFMAAAERAGLTPAAVIARIAAAALARHQGLALPLSRRPALAPAAAAASAGLAGGDLRRRSARRLRAVG